MASNDTDPPSAKSKEPVYATPAAASVGHAINSHLFEGLMSFVIMFNMFMIIVETDHSASHDDPLLWAEVVGWTILGIFIVELALRLFALRKSFFKDYWNTFDFCIVVVDGAFSFIGLVLGDVFPVSALRVFRLCKLARVSKVFRVFPELRIMMAGLIGSFRAIFWGTVLLAFVLLVWSIIAVQFIHPLNKELAESGGLEGCERCPRAYSSVLHASLTFSQQIITGDSWGQATIPLIEAYPITSIYFLAVFLSVGFAVMNLILGVVVNIAQSEHDHLKKEIEDEMGFQLMEERDLLITMCSDMDKDGSGELTKDELIHGFRERKEFREALEKVDLNEDDLVIAFSSMDPDKSGTVTYIEFVKKLYQMKETDTAFALEQVKFYLLQLREIILNEKMPESAELVTCSHLPDHIVEILSPKTASRGEGALDRSPDNANSAVVDITQEKEQKISLRALRDARSGVQAKDQTSGVAALRAAGGQTEDSAGSTQSVQAASGENQRSDEVLAALKSLSKVFSEELREAMTRMEAVNEQQAAQTSKLLSQLELRIRPFDDLVSARRNVASGISCAPVLPQCMRNA